MDEGLTLDGNGVAGLLDAAFDTGDHGRPALRLVRHRRERSAPTAPTAPAGVVLRCPACHDLAITIVELPDRHVVQIRGAWAFALPRD